MSVCIQTELRHAWNSADATAFSTGRCAQAQSCAARKRTGPTRDLWPALRTAVIYFLAAWWWWCTGLRGTAFTMVSSTGVRPVESRVAPAGIRVVDTLFVPTVPV